MQQEQLVSSGGNMVLAPYRYGEFSKLGDFEIVQALDERSTSVADN